MRTSGEAGEGLAEEAGPKRYNMRNPGVKRIMQEVKELQENDSDGSDFVTEALENNIFEWHFTIRGPPDTPFDGGVYHGRIILPFEYPFKPPSFMMLTPNGRWEVGSAPPPPRVRPSARPVPALFLLRFSGTAPALFPRPPTPALPPVAGP